VLKRISVLIMAILLALLVATPVTFAQVGQGSKASGAAEELAADWWQWALSKPVSENPLVGGDPDYSAQQCDGRPLSDTPGKKWFLAGTFDSSTVERTCTIPVGTQLFFPVGNVVFLITEPNEDEEVARQFVNEFIDNVLADPELSISITVDGKEIKSNRIVRAESPLFTATLPEDNLFSSFGLPAGDYEGVADGLWATLPPLSKGEHTIHFEISAPSLGFEQDNTYHLTVVNKGGLRARETA
jgi:hypothetical protein